MNIFKKLFSKKKDKNIESLDWGKSYYEHLYNKIVESCEKQTMTYYSVRGMFRHLPLRYDPNNANPEEINQIVDKCFKLLYDYCIEKNLIDTSITYEEFYDGKGLYDESYPISKWYGKNGPLGNLLD